MHEGLPAGKQQNGEPAHVIVVLEVGDQHVRALGLLGLGELGCQKLRHLLREVDEVPLAEEERLELRRKTGLGREATPPVIGRGARATQVRGHEGLGGARVQLQLALAHDVH